MPVLRFWDAYRGSRVHGDNADASGPAGYFNGRVVVTGNLCAANVSCASDRNLKAGFEPVNTSEVLDKVAALPLTTWNYKTDESTRHLGPMAQNFHAALGLGTDDKHITTVDAERVAPAAVQGLNEKLKRRTAAQEQVLKVQEAEIQELKSAVAELMETVAQLTRSTRSASK